ncbi:hypothetical protein MIND_00700700 [Mycena indigotica]|uniref:RRM domain-containing protein n=1 Tax=Mycena indigotica TaxID=2126181 RepID=A0A8H6SKE9_9AGAR|nr:uncharacterized protein MIND_00700700 [Mycena indigotica]KAF7301355.1 hypothetical protein MIND_00700700 [Mycena indigotica]
MSRLFLQSAFSQAWSASARDDVYDYLQRFGTIVELKIIANRSFSYGFAQFESVDDANCVLETFRGRLFLGHPLLTDTTIEPARPLRKDMKTEERLAYSTPSRRGRVLERFPVIVENLAPHIRWQELKDFARLENGLVAYCDVERGNTGRGFIEYHTSKDAETALRLLDGRKLGGRSVRLSAPSFRSRRSSRSRSPRRPRDRAMTSRYSPLHRRPSSDSQSSASASDNNNNAATPVFPLLSRAMAYHDSVETTNQTESIWDRDYNCDPYYLYAQYDQKLHQCY